VLGESKMVCCVAGDLQKVHASVVLLQWTWQNTTRVGKEGKEIITRSERKDREVTPWLVKCLATLSIVYITVLWIE